MKSRNKRILKTMAALALCLPLALPGAGSAAAE